MGASRTNPDSRLAYLSWRWRRIEKESSLNDGQIHDLPYYCVEFHNVADIKEYFGTNPSASSNAHRVR